jgi:hypothetical protein
MLILLFFISILLRYKSRDKKISRDKSRDKILSRDESRDSLSRDRGNAGPSNVPERS